MPSDDDSKQEILHWRRVVRLEYTCAYPRVFESWIEYLDAYPADGDRSDLEPVVVLYCPDAHAKYWNRGLM